MLYSMNPSYANVITPIGVYHTPTHKKKLISAAITLYMYTEETIVYTTHLVCVLLVLSVVSGLIRKLILVPTKIFVLYSRRYTRIITIIEILHGPACTVCM